ncbi:MAG: hemolysin III family protein [Planctomycetota bacterium]
MSARSDEPADSPASKTGDAPLRHNEEWANALTHGLAALAWLVAGFVLVWRALSVDAGLAVACAAYVASVVGTFVSSWLSHTVLTQPWLDRFRSWDQGCIYLMITGTYTPIAFRYAAHEHRTVLLMAIWIAAACGMWSKVAVGHRVNQIGTWSYLLLGWLPAIPLYQRVPSELGLTMLVGGVVYTLGVVVLMNDHRAKYLHSCWHLLVILASITHGIGIARYVVASP